MKSKILAIVLLLLSLIFVFSCGNNSSNTDSNITVKLNTDSELKNVTFSKNTGNTISKPNKAGNTFLGYYNAEGVQYFNENGKQADELILTNEISLYAKFEPYKYTLELYAPTGRFEDNTNEKSIDVYYGDNLSEKILDVLNNNPKYELDGYFDESGINRLTKGKEPLFSLDSYKNGDVIKMYAKFKVKELTVTLDFNDGITWPEKIKVKYGDKIGDLSAYTKTNGDMEISSWSMSPILEQNIKEEITEDITIFAVWRKYVFVSFVYPDNVIKSQKVYVAEGKSSIMPSNDIPGYAFQGWYDNEQLLGNPVSNVSQGALLSQYYGKWATTSYIISFNTDGGSIINPIEYRYGDSFKLPDNKKYGYMFKAWKMKGYEGLHTEITPDMWGNLEISAVYDLEYTAIFNENDLKNIAKNPSGKYFLANDITLKDNWVTIESFEGLLDGNSFTIFNLTSIYSGEFQKNNVCGFIYKNIGVLKNINFENALIDVNFYSNKSVYPHVGILALTNYGEIFNCHVYNSTIKSNFNCTQYSDVYIGAISGGNSNKIEQCSANCTITSTASGAANAHIGGIVGVAYGTVSNCYAILNCKSKGSAQQHVGGITGSIWKDNLTTSCYANVEVTKNDNISTANIFQTDFSNGTGHVKNSFTNHTLEKSKATSPSYIYDTLGWDKEIWEVVEGEYPRLKSLNKNIKE